MVGGDAEYYVSHMDSKQLGSTWHPASRKRAATCRGVKVCLTALTTVANIAKAALDRCRPAYTLGFAAAKFVRR